MNKHWILLSSIPAAGKTLVINDQAFWRDTLEEFGVDCHIVEPLEAKVAILPQAEGVLFRGTVTGRVSLPCDRCASDSFGGLEHSFNSYEPYPPDALLADAKTAKAAKADRRLREEEGDASSLDEVEVDSAVMRLATHGRGVEINPAALAWEEFSLALPVKPLCADDCKGLCPTCGCNKNTEQCTCVKDVGDPRFAALRNITISKKE